MTRSRSRALVVLLAGLMGLLAGCQAGTAVALDDQPLRTADGLAGRSLALDSLAQRQAAPATARSAVGMPWYAARNDARLTVSAGLAVTTIESSVRITTDRQRIHDGRIHDHTSTTTYSRRYSETAR